VNLGKVKKVLQNQFIKKSTRQKELVTSFQEIVSLNAGKWSLAALVEIGKFFDNWSDVIIKLYVLDFENDFSKTSNIPVLMKNNEINFIDRNGNKKLDLYEDYRQTINDSKRYFIKN
jgi:hypothetical protein